MSSHKQKKVFQYGNFDQFCNVVSVRFSYYGYRSASFKSFGENSSIWNDHRLEQLKKRYFKKKSVLDIGCNAGYLTISLAERFKPAMILGIDIDGTLISKARAVLNMRANENSEIIHDANYPTDETASQNTDDTLMSFQNYSVKGHSIYSDAGAFQQLSDDLFRKFPYTVYFKQENFLDSVHYGGPYDTITCFSVTKWIHLNWGDEGFLLLLIKSCMLLKEGGYLIIEYQPWSSYKKRQYYTDVIAANYPKLRLRPERIPAILVRFGMRLVKELKPMQKGPPGFNRNITVFQRMNVSLELNAQSLILSKLHDVLDVDTFIKEFETNDFHVCNNQVNNNIFSSAQGHLH